jgi:hypothetical protein
VKDGRDTVAALIYNTRTDSKTPLWAVELSYNVDGGKGQYHGIFSTDDKAVNVRGNFDSKNNFLQADIFNKNGFNSFFEKDDNGKKTEGMNYGKASDLNLDGRWKKGSRKIPSLAVGLARLLGGESKMKELLGDGNAEKLLSLYDNNGGTVSMMTESTGENSLRITMKGPDVTIMVDYIFTKKKEDEQKEKKKQE